VPGAGCRGVAAQPQPAFPSSAPALTPGHRGPPARPPQRFSAASRRLGELSKDAGKEVAHYARLGLAWEPGLLRHPRNACLRLLKMHTLRTLQVRGLLAAKWGGGRGGGS
jgi:hypothetical protein